MALAYDATCVTRDVDARFVPHGIVLEEARRVADELALDPRLKLSHRAIDFGETASNLYFELGASLMR